MTDPPPDFEKYVEWRYTTPEGKAWWREAVSKNNVRFVCERCGYEVWFPRSGGTPETMLCPFPCTGTRRQMEPPEFWEEGR